MIVIHDIVWICISTIDARITFAFSNKLPHRLPVGFTSFFVGIFIV